jgi:hypothetical protein
MEITKELVNILTPEHGRTSCSDENVCNGYCKIEDKKYKGVVIERSWDCYPRCNRCFLLLHIGEDTENVGQVNGGIRVVPDIDLEIIQPKVKITVEPQ